MIRAWTVPIAPVDDRGVRPVHLHAVVAGMLDRSHWAPSKAWALAPLAYDGGCQALQIVTMVDGAASLVEEAAVPGAPLRLGGQETVILVPPILEAEVSSEDLLALPHESAMVIDFVTPTTFRRRQRSMPLPEPVRLLNSLRSKWRLCFGDEGGEVVYRQLDSDEVWVTDIDGRNKVFKVSGMTVSGFVGRIRYQCETDHAAKSFGALTAMATLTGVGSYTTRTLGRISRERTWG